MAKKPQTQAAQEINSETPGKAPTSPEISALQEPVPYSTAIGNYNRESGRKTLVFVGFLIASVTALSIITLLLINKKSSLIIQSKSTANKQLSQQLHTTATTPVLTVSPEVKELDAITLDTPDTDIEQLQKEAKNL